MRSCTVAMCEISISWRLSPSRSKYLLDRGSPHVTRGLEGTQLLRHAVPCHSPLVAGKTADHGFRALRVPKSHKEGGS